MLWLHAIANPSVTCEDWCHEPCILCRVILPGRSVVCVVCVEVWLWGLPGNNYQHMHTCHTYDSRAGARARRSYCGHTPCTGCAAACARRSCCRHTPCSCSSSAAARARREAAAAAAFPALAAQPPVLAAAADLAPHWPQTMRARCATNSQRTKRLARPNRRARRQQIPDPRQTVWGG